VARTSPLLLPRTLFLGQHVEEEHTLVAPGRPALWILDATEQSPVAARLAPLVLDASELSRAESFRRSADRGLYLVAHVGLRALLGSRLGLAANEVRLGREACVSCGGPHGRPVVAGGSVGQGAEVHFSLSHSGTLALIGLASAPVGVDVENVPPPDVAEEVGAALHPAEATELAALPGRAKSVAFARTWARKEAYLKGIGTGLSRAPALDYVGTGPDPAPALPGWTIHDVRVPDAYAAAVAVSGPPAPGSG
jgi:4'-phosphopantetheinyl transferase